MAALIFLISLAILELGLFVIGPALQSSAGPDAANLFYIGLRVITLLTFGFLCVRRLGRSMFGVLTMTGFLIFWDQVVFKSLWLVLEIRKNPTAWQGVDTRSAIFNVAFSYVVSLPVVLLVAFLGARLAQRKR